MKAVVVEIKGDFVAALVSDGCILKTRNNNYAIGQVIELKRITLKTRMIMKIAGAVACLMLFCGVGTYAYMIPTSYVSIDVNPSIEYSLNIFNRVLSAKAVNEDGSEILSEITNLKHKTIGNAIQLTVDRISKEGYFDSDIEGGIVIATSGKNLKKSAVLAEKLNKIVTLKCEKNEDKVMVDSIAVGKERVEDAKALGITPGKLNLIEKLQKSFSETEEIDINKWLNKPVKEIMKATKENRKAHKAEDGTSSNVGKPDTSKPDTSEPDTSRPDTSKPNTSKPDTSKPVNSCKEDNEYNTSKKDKPQNKGKDENKGKAFN